MPAIVVSHRVRKNESENVHTSRAERDSDSHFVRALGDGVGDHTVNADRRQDEREPGKQRRAIAC